MVSILILIYFKNVKIVMFYYFEQNFIENFLGKEVIQTCCKFSAEISTEKYLKWIKEDLLVN